MLILVALVVTIAGCAAVQPVNPGAPRGNQPPYPAVLTDLTRRTELARAAWVQLTSQQGIVGKPELPLQPVTATIRSLPQDLSGSFYLHKFGTSAQMNEEETRESLRRFLNEWKTLLGADPAQLTLVNEIIGNDGTRTASYEQRPFGYPLRGDFGKVEVRFAPDRRILEVSSTAIPDSERIQALLNAAFLQIKTEDIPAKLVGRTVPYTDSSGSHTFTITSATETSVQQLVVYPRLAARTPPALELYLAWEITLANAPVKVLYLDAMQDEVVGVAPLQ